MATITENSGSWGWTKITMAETAASQRGPDQPCRSCRVFQLTGTGYMSYTTATSAGIPLPTTASTALNMPVRNLNQLHFLAGNSEVTMIIWRA